MRSDNEMELHGGFSPHMAVNTGLDRELEYEISVVALVLTGGYLEICHISDTCSGKFLYAGYEHIKTFQLQNYQLLVAVYEQDPTKTLSKMQLFVCPETMIASKFLYKMCFFSNVFNALYVIIFTPKLCFFIVYYRMLLFQH
jgi:hypothetical protein